MTAIAGRSFRHGSNLWSGAHISRLGSWLGRGPGPLVLVPFLVLAPILLGLSFLAAFFFAALFAALLRQTQIKGGTLVAK